MQPLSNINGSNPLPFQTNFERCLLILLGVLLKHNLFLLCAGCHRQVQVQFLRRHVPAHGLWDPQKFRLELPARSGDLACMRCVILSVCALARLPALDVGQDRSVFEARVDALIREDHSVTTVAHVLTVATRQLVKVFHVRPAP